MKTKTTKSILILFVAVLFFSYNAYSQNLDNVGGVSINLDNSPPEKCAILDVKSSDKGVLIPRMTLYERDHITNLVEGLQVYVTDLAQRGIHYYDGSNWVRLGGGGSVPPGGIIMYYGPITTDASGLFETDGKGRAGTPMQGWALCNGNYNTPNMQGMFTVGAKYAVDNNNNYAEYNTIGGNAGNDMTTLSVNNMPAHNHYAKTGDSDVGTITGNITGSGDASITGLTAGGAGGHSHTTPGEHATGSGTDGFNRPNSTSTGNSDGEVSTSSVVDHTHDVSGDAHLSNISINVSFPAGGTHNHGIQSQGGGQAFDNRPAYFVVAYIMRIYDDPSIAPVGTTFPSVITQ